MTCSRTDQILSTRSEDAWALMAGCAGRLSAFLPFFQTSAIAKPIVRPTYVHEALGHQLKESKGPR